MMYLGSKTKLLSFIYNTINETVGDSLNNLTFCDLFAGSGKVSIYFKDKVKMLISNDIEKYSYVLLESRLGNTVITDEMFRMFNLLKESKPVKGFIYNEYSNGGSGNRLYFSEATGMAIDGFRIKLNEINEIYNLNKSTYNFLLDSILELASNNSNTSGSFTAFFKTLKSRLLKSITLEIPNVILCNSKVAVYNKDSNDLIDTIKGDVLYLDPPYNGRQYGSYYHLLNTIVEYIPFKPVGITGLNVKESIKSNYCYKRKAGIELDSLLKRANFKYIFLSYSNEGIIPISTIENIMKRYGIYRRVDTEYKRYSAYSKYKNRSKSTTTKEYIHILIKDI